MFCFVTCVCYQGLAVEQMSLRGENLVLVQGNARLALALLAKLGVQKAILVGHSQGALIALEMYKQ